MSPKEWILPVGEFVTVHVGVAPAELSIVVPLYGQRQYVAEAVGSVLAQQDVVAEIIVSDDASVDGTLDVALHAVREAIDRGDLPHHVVLRRGGVRLRRDHLHLLADAASCDVVMQAHGDDVSLPLRSRRLLDAIESTGAAMVGSRVMTIDEYARSTSVADELAAPIVRLSIDEVFAVPSWLVGASMAWRRSALAVFEPISGGAVPSAHDFVMIRRAVMAGGVVGVNEVLLHRRLHGANWSGRMYDENHPAARAFGSSIEGLVLIRRVMADLDRAVSLGLVEPDDASHINGLLSPMRARRLDTMADSFTTLVISGLRPRWLPEDDLANDLGAVLGRWARRDGPIQRVLVRGDRARHWVKHRRRRGRPEPRRAGRG